MNGLPTIDGVTLHDFTSEDEWLAWRRAVITGSDTAAIVKGKGGQGLAKYRGEWDVWSDKTQPPKSHEDNDRFRRGRYLEAGVLSYVEAEQTAPGESLLRPVGKQAYQRGMFGCTPDAVTVDDEGNPIRGEETKTVGYSGKDDWTAEDGTLRLPVWIQMQSRLYMHVTGLPVWRIHVYLMPDTFHTFTLMRHDALERTIVEQCEAWWQRHVTGGEAPVYDDSRACTAYLQAAYPDHEFSPKVATDEDVAQVVAYREARDAEKAAKKAKGIAANHLRAAIADTSGLTIDGRVVASIKDNGAISVK